MTKRQNTGPVIPRGVSNIWDGLSSNEQDSLLFYMLTPITNLLAKSLTLLVYQYYECPYDRETIEMRVTNSKKKLPLVNPVWVTSIQISSNHFLTKYEYIHPDYRGAPCRTLSTMKREKALDPEEEWTKCVERHMHDRCEVYVRPLCDMKKFIKMFPLRLHEYVLLADSLKIFYNEELIRTIPLPMCFFCLRECGFLRFHDCVPFEGNLVIVFSCGNQFVVKHFTV